MVMKKIFYRVQKGESLRSICQKFSAPPFSVIKDNYLEAEPLEGDMLVIVEYNDLRAVKPLETFESLSAHTGVSVEDLMRLNPTPYLIYGINVRIK